ncbi:MAG: transglutaminase domain-containing protein [Actinomycetota bacterium]|nr:transglutaminase domain-containing protein [Actinomycetota bacterium]
MSEQCYTPPDAGSPPPVPPAPPRRRSMRPLTLLLVITLAICVAAAAITWVWLLPDNLMGSGEEGGSTGDVWGSELSVSFEFEYDVHLLGENTSIDFTVAIPRTLEMRQEVGDISFNPQPLEVFDDGDNRYARFLFQYPVQDFTVTISGNARLFGYDLSRAMEVPGPRDDWDAGEYLEGERYLEVTDEGIQSAAVGIEGRDALQTVELVYDYVLENMEYSGYEPGEVGAAEALRRGNGDCTEFSDLMVTLCRAKGIPTRFAEGFVIDDFTGIYVHDWVEAYIEPYGWAPFDPTYADSGSASFKELEPILLRTSDKRNDDILQGYHYWSYSYEGDPVEISDHYRFRITSKLE